MAHHETHQFQSDVSWTLEAETLNVMSVVSAKFQVYPVLSVFHLSEKRIFLSSCPSCLCHETLQVLDQWMAEPRRQKSTNTNNRNVASGTLSTSQKLTCFLKTATMQTPQRLPDCHQTVQEVLGHLSEYQLCLRFHPTHHHSHQCYSQHFLHSVPHHPLHTH